MMPLARIERASSSMSACSTWSRGWNRFGDEPVDVDVEHGVARLGRGVRDQRAQAFAERGSLVCHGVLSFQLRYTVERRILACEFLRAWRSRNSRASARYASAPRDFTS